MWTSLDGGGSANNRTFRNKKNLAFRGSVLEFDTPSTEAGIAIYFAFRTFLHAIRSEMGKGGVCQTDDVGQGGGVQKVSFRSDVFGGG